MGSAADAMACSGPIVTACARTNGSRSTRRASCFSRWMNTTVLPEPMSVAVTDSDSRCPRRMFCVMRGHGISRSTTRSSCRV